MLKRNQVRFGFQMLKPYNLEHFTTPFKLSKFFAKLQKSNEMLEWWKLWMFWLSECFLKYKPSQPALACLKLAMVALVLGVNSFMMGRSLSYRNQSTDLFCKSNWFLYDMDLHYERVKSFRGWDWRYQNVKNDDFLVSLLLAWSILRSFLWSVCCWLWPCNCLGGFHLFWSYFRK